MRLLNIFCFEKTLMRERERLFAVGKFSLLQGALEIFFDEFRRIIHVDIARKRYDEIFGVVAFGDVIEQVLPRKVFYVFGGPKDRSAVPLFAEIRFCQNIEAEVVGRVLRHGDLLEHDPLFPLHFILGEHRVQDEIG